MTRHGYGFVEASEGDYFIPARDTAGAMHGDIVAVRPDTHKGRQGRAGVVARVIERANTTIVGRFERHGAIGMVTPADRRLRHDVFVGPNAMGEATTGDVVVVCLTAYPSRSHAAQGYVEEIIGRDDDPDIQIEITIREHGLRTEFPSAVAEEADKLRIDVADAMRREPDRVDIRDRFTFTIDPVDARDFDDAITIDHVDGRLRLGVHIADVSHYVPWDSSIDNEARLRATSVYLVDRVLPMLPEELSNGICSLNPDEDRLSFSVDMWLSRDGVVEEYKIFPSVMRSDRRFNYDQVDRWLSGGEPFPDAASEQALRDFARASAKIGERRVARGGLDFETVEAKVRLDAEGKPKPFFGGQALGDRCRLASLGGDHDGHARRTRILSAKLGQIVSIFPYNLVRSGSAVTAALAGNCFVPSSTVTSRTGARYSTTSSSRRGSAAVGSLRSESAVPEATTS